MLSDRQFSALKWLASKASRLSSWLTILTLKSARARADGIRKRAQRKGVRVASRDGFNPVCLRWVRAG